MGLRDVIRKTVISTLSGYGLGVTLNVITLGTTGTTLSTYLSGSVVYFGVALGFALGLVYGIDREHNEIEQGKS